MRGANHVDEHLGRRVRMRRLTLGMSQGELADRLGITFQQVQKYEKGANRISASRLQQMSDILEVPILFFYQGGPKAAGKAAGRSSGNNEGPIEDYITDFLADADGHALIKAFAQIKNARLRRSVIDMVQAVAKLDRA